MENSFATRVKVSSNRRCIVPRRSSSSSCSEAEAVSTSSSWVVRNWCRSDSRSNSCDCFVADIADPAQPLLEPADLALGFEHVDIELIDRLVQQVRRLLELQVVEDALPDRGHFAPKALQHNRGASALTIDLHESLAGGLELLLALHHPGRRFPHRLLCRGLLGDEAQPIGFTGGDILLQLEKLPRDLGAFAVETRSAFQPLGELLRQGGLLGEERRKLTSLGAEPLVQHRTFLQRGRQPLLQLTQALGVTIELLDGALMALASLLQRRFELAPFLFGTGTGCFLLSHPRDCFLLPAGIASLSGFLLLQPAREPAALTIELANAGFRREARTVELTQFRLPFRKLSRCLVQAIAWRPRSARPMYAMVSGSSRSSRSRVKHAVLAHRGTAGDGSARTSDFAGKGDRAPATREPPDRGACRGQIVDDDRAPEQCIGHNPVLGLTETRSAAMP